MTNPTRAAYESALHKLNELSERLATGRQDDGYLYRLANAAQDAAIAAREVYAEAREKALLLHRRAFSRAWMGENMAGSRSAVLPNGYAASIHFSRRTPILSSSQYDNAANSPHFFSHASNASSEISPAEHASRCFFASSVHCWNSSRVIVP